MAEDNSDLTLSVLAEASGNVVKVEMKNGSTYRGKVSIIDKAGNIELTNVSVQNRDSSLSVEERVLLRNAQVRLIHLPPEFVNSPLLNTHSAQTLNRLKKSLRRKAPTNKAAKKDHSGNKEKKRLKSLRL
ncbi:small nuclear ribonucleoprotein D3 [Angomonas deanei]|uniref:LSM domain containing protein, putative n=1 Tax=Angomonas deanei TaxID=59799 RepID=A0A7G2C4Q9_9TRYP|nr:small nuclear ribonucleoprotein D3 [Angomonas deanei]CAD2214134.1 LSM domain containing protein, putative [Angomonas deanei]|eukprot:EPY39106.1 small nuclear ribonucleoprotein D3 [Angomonas deanei]